MNRTAALLLLLACHGKDDDTGKPTPAPAPEPTSETGPPAGTDTELVTSDAADPPLLKFATFGDYGSGNAQEQSVADLVGRRAPDFIVTLGDNVYDTTDGHDERIGQYYHDWIAPYTGTFGAGSPDGVNRFWACLGNHDWDATIDDWYAYFELPNNERYYTQTFGADPGGGGPLLELFCVDSDSREPDGNTASSVQAGWLRDGLAASTARWKVVVFHHPPWSSGLHGPNRRLQWPWASWGADVVLHGHDHVYERLVRDGALFATEGRGGAGLYSLRDPMQHSQVILNDEVGATIVELREDTLRLETWDTEDRRIDQVELRKGLPLMADDPIVRMQSEWRYSATGADLGTAWREPGFDDSAWATGWGQLGYGDADEATTVASGPAADNFTTTYFRRAFDVADPTRWTDLALDLLRDDGAVVWLNGAEVLRSNLPAGEITASTQALEDLLSPDEDEVVTATVPASRLVAGTNVLAVEVHQATPTTKDASFDLALRGVNTRRLVKAGSSWSYLDGGVAPGAGWRTSTDAAGWSEGPAPLGYGHEDLATVLDGGDPTQLRATTWLRSTFELADPESVHDLLLRVIRDDGAVVWLNGVELTRFNLPTGPLGAGTYAVSEVPEGWETRWTETFVDPGALLAGTNVVAVELHQALPAGRNLRFDLELVPVGD